MQLNKQSKFTIRVPFITISFMFIISSKSRNTSKIRIWIEENYGIQDPVPLSTYIKVQSKWISVLLIASCHKTSQSWKFLHVKDGKQAVHRCENIHTIGGRSSIIPKITMYSVLQIIGKQHCNGKKWNKSEKEIWWHT